MKPQVFENAIDEVLQRTLLQNRQVIAVCMAAAAPNAVEIAYDRVTVERQIRHLQASGTADLVVRLWYEREVVALLLIENKIDAGFTPDQPARYKTCRDAHLVAGSARFVATLLVCPVKYLSGSRLKSEFDGCISYEDLRTFLQGEDLELVDSAIQRAERPYEPIAVPAVMGFFQGYSVIANATAPDLIVKRNPNSADARPEASRTIYFDTTASGIRRYPFLLKGERPASIRVSHQCWDSGAPTASVKLMLDGWAGQLLRVAPVLSSELRNSGIYLRTAGRSLALVSDTKRLDNMRSAFDQKDIIVDALGKIQRIRSMWNSMERSLQDILPNAPK
ncbi:MAG: hypothetical protein SGJ03_15395 [Alphaproteobacteria bacterium]|nr:hypothetical protein [Alphaproteobacteria bacterium]